MTKVNQRADQKLRTKMRVVDIQASVRYDNFASVKKTYETNRLTSLLTSRIHIRIHPPPTPHTRGGGQRWRRSLSMNAALKIELQNKNKAFS